MFVLRCRKIRSRLRHLRTRDTVASGRFSCHQNGQAGYARECWHGNDTEPLPQTDGHRQMFRRHDLHNSEENLLLADTYLQEHGESL